MVFLQSSCALRMVLLMVILGIGACTGVQEPVPQPQHYYDKTEVDLEYGRPEAIRRYHRLRGVQHYISDETDIDLASPRVSQGTEESGAVPPSVQPKTPDTTPLPGGGR